MAQPSRLMGHRTSIGGVEYFPLKSVADYHGLSLEWDALTQKVTLYKDGRYLSFIVGLGSGIIDYEAREREKVFEIDRQAALAATEAICQHLLDLTESPCAKSLRICCNSDRGTLRATSSITRELDFLLSHTIHHYAIIAMLCRLQNVEVEPDFGVAPSTLRYQLTSKMQCAIND